MQATTQLKDIINEQNRYVQVVQGGKWWQYWTTGNYLNYEFSTTHYVDDHNLAKIYYVIAKEFVEKISENRLILLSAQWQMKELEKREGKTWIPPVYVEDGLMQKFKEELMESDDKDILWDDYMWFEEKQTQTLILKRPTTIRNYYRFIYFLMENPNFPLMDKISKCAMEGGGSVGVRLFAQSLQYKNLDKSDLYNFAQSSDYVLRMGFDDKSADIVIRNNPRYISYEEIVEIIEPIFNKYGLVFTSKENPYIKDFGCEGKCHQCERMCKYNLNPEYHT